jgi:hypothetical protein
LAANTSGTTRAARLLSDDQLAYYQPWFGNQRRPRDLITELETLSQEIAGNDSAGTASQPRQAWSRSACYPPL